MIRAAALVLVVALSACAQKTSLTQAPGMSLPPVPYGAEDPLTSEELLTPSPQAVPERSVELRSENEEREDDPFDLPPER